MIHGYEVLQMMQGNSYSSKEELVKAIISRFGEVERFYTCSAEGMTVAQLVDFPKQRDKFKSAHLDGLTVDALKVCNHQSSKLAPLFFLSIKVSTPS